MLTAAPAVTPRMGAPQRDGRQMSHPQVKVRPITHLSDRCEGEPLDPHLTPREEPLNGQNVGYIRVSSADQNTDRQLDGVPLDVVFTDKVSGKDTAREQLQAMLRHVRAGDTLHVHSLDRLARNLIDLRTLVDDLTSRGVEVRFHKENLTFTGGTGDPMSTLMLNLLGSFAEFERAIIRERQREGIALAKQRGAYKGRKPSLTAQQADEIRARAAAGEPKASLARAFGISRETVYAYLRQAG